MDNHAPQIPQAHQDFIRSLVELGKKHGLAEFSGTIAISSFEVPNELRWDEPIMFKWHRGRHSEPDPIQITSTVYVRTTAV